MRKEFEKLKFTVWIYLNYVLRLFLKVMNQKKLDWFEAPSLESWQKARNQIERDGLTE